MSSTPPTTAPAALSPRSPHSPWWLRLLQRALRWRYVKFGVVGASGTVINTVVLYACQEWWLRDWLLPEPRLYVSLAVAILVATINNFFWNRLWTWADRYKPVPEFAGAAPASVPHATDDDPTSATAPSASRAAASAASPIASQGVAAPGLLVQFGRYCLASWLGTALQYGLTLWLSQQMHLHYVVANVIAIVVASVSNFLANDLWTFRRRPRR